MVEKKGSGEGDNLDQAFQDANNFVKSYKDPSVKLTNDEKLKFYALFKQSTVGECKGKLYSIIIIIQIM